MGRNNVYRTLATAAIAALLTCGCAEEHKKFTEQPKKDWEKARLSIMYEVADQEFKVGDYDKCRTELTKMLATGAPFAPMHVLQAKVDLEGGSLDNAATNLKKAVEINSSDPETYYLLGVVYQRWQKLDTAADYYMQAVAKKPDEAVYVLAAAEMKISLGDLDDAEQFLQDKMLYFEQSAAMRIALAKIDMLKGNPEAAAKAYRDATQLVPEDKNVRWAYAGALFDAGKFSDASKILEDMRNDPPETPKADDSLTKAGDAAVDEQAAKATKISMLMMLGESYVGMQRAVDAQGCFQEVIRLEPENLSAYLSLGKACLLTNDLNLTLAAAKKVLRAEPENVSALILEAAVQQKQKKWAESRDTLTGAAKASPKDATVLVMLGISEMQLGKKPEAAIYLERAVAADPTDTWASNLLAEVRPPAPGVEGKADGVDGVKESNTLTNAAPGAAPAEDGGLGR